MNRRAQTGVLTLIFFDIVFIILWALVLGDLLNTFIAQGVASGNFSGYELFFLTTAQFWIWLGVIAANVAGFAFAAGGSQ